MSEELKPCPFPFCKSDLVCVTHDTYFEGRVFYVKCRKCNAQGPHFLKDEQAAISAWNRRS